MDVRKILLVLTEHGCLAKGKKQSMIGPHTRAVPGRQQRPCTGKENLMNPEVITRIVAGILFLVVLSILIMRRRKTV